MMSARLLICTMGTVVTRKVNVCCSWPQLEDTVKCLLRGRCDPQISFQPGRKVLPKTGLLWKFHLKNTFFFSEAAWQGRCLEVPHRRTEGGRAGGAIWRWCGSTSPQTQPAARPVSPLLFCGPCYQKQAVIRCQDWLHGCFHDLTRQACGTSSPPHESRRKAEILCKCLEWASTCPLAHSRSQACSGPPQVSSQWHLPAKQGVAPSPLLTQCLLKPQQRLRLSCGADVGVSLLTSLTALQAAGKSNHWQM